MNYYFRSRVTGLPAPASSTLALFDFLPTQTYRHPQNPTAPPCPTTCTDSGPRSIRPGFRTVLGEAGSYHLPIYVTENGLADSNDDQRAKYLVDHLRVLRGAMRSGLARVKGYFALVADGQLRVVGRLLPEVRVLLGQPAHARPPRAPERPPVQANCTVAERCR